MSYGAHGISQRGAGNRTCWVYSGGRKLERPGHIQMQLGIDYSLAHMCAAAQKRLQLWENRADGGLAVDARFAQLQDAISNTEHLARVVQWNEWYQTGPIATLYKNSRELDTLGLHSDALLNQAGWDDIDPADRDSGVRKVRKQFQKCARKTITRMDLPDNVGRIRVKLKRWRLSGIELTTATRCARMLKDLPRCTPPRVVAAVWRTMWNGWTTSRRFQKTGSCLLCCNSTVGDDSIEHYARCSVLRDLCHRFIGLPDSHDSTWLGNFVVLGLNHGSVCEGTLAKRAIAVYATYRTTNKLRHSPCTDCSIIKDMMCQFAREAVRGHGPATRFLEAQV